MPAEQLKQLKPKRVLVITLRFLGDALLTTPLIHSLKQAYPHATLDVLTTQTNAGMFEGNPDINQIIGIKNKPGMIAFVRLLIGIFQQYDLAVSTQAGDRPVLAAIIAGKTSLGFIPEETSKAWWKKRLLSAWLIFSRHYNHAVIENLRFCRLLDVKALHQLTPPSAKYCHLPVKPYAVLHLNPQWRYKEWHSAGWRALASYIHAQQVNIVLTGSDNNTEQQKLKVFENSLPFPVTNLAGQLSLGQIAELIKNALFFLGPDTGITHLAAATGTTTFALFGPTDPTKWAPWPVNYHSDVPPFATQGSHHMNNVYLIQGKSRRDCIPCQLEGCDNSRDSHSECLDSLETEDVINTIKFIFINLDIQQP